MAEVCHVYDTAPKVKPDPKVKAEPKVKAGGKVQTEGKVKTESKGKGTGKGPAKKGKTLKRKRANVKPEPDSDIEEVMEVDQLREDPEGAFTPVAMRATPPEPERVASAPPEDDVGTQPRKRQRRAATTTRKRYTHSAEEMAL